MELKELKSTWKSIEQNASLISIKNAEATLPKRKKDILQCLNKRFIIDIISVCIAGIALATSRMWAPVQMPAWWICAFCLLFLAIIIATIIIMKKLGRINLGESTHIHIMETILAIKRFYRDMELYGCAGVAVLMICVPFVSPIGNTLFDITCVLSFCVIGFYLEFLWYRANIRKINEMHNWVK